jgi:hypothetical protein
VPDEAERDRVLERLGVDDPRAADPSGNEFVVEVARA